MVKYGLAGVGGAGVAGAAGYWEWLRHRYVPGAPVVEDRRGMLAATSAKVTTTTLDSGSRCCLVHLIARTIHPPKIA